MKPYYVLPLLLLLFSCKNEKEEQLKRDIVGEWKFIKVIDSTERNPNDSDFAETTYLVSDFELHKDGTYTEKSGFWDFDERSKSRWRLKYYGWDSRYEIEDDSMFVFIPMWDSWRRLRMHYFKGDSLVCDFGGEKYAVFARQHYKTDPAEQYDEIIVNSGGSFGSCPVYEVGIAKTGKMYFYGLHTDAAEGDFTARVNPEVFFRIQEEFKKSGIDTLREEYTDATYDTGTVTVTFIKNGKIYKTVTDHDAQSPQEFKDAYNHVRYLFHTLKQDKFTALKTSR